MLYGEPRLTRDIDITLGVDIDRLEGVLAVAQELALRPIPQDLPTFVKETMVFPAIDETTGIRVDFIFSFSPYEFQAIQRAKKIIIMDQEVLFASPEDVIIHKIFAGRIHDALTFYYDHKFEMDERWKMAMKETELAREIHPSLLEKKIGQVKDLHG